MKLGSLTDAVYTRAVVDEIAFLSRDGARSAEIADALVQVPPV